MPQINIIIPVYNNQSDIERCLQSLSQQTFENWQAICVDDGSTDATGAILDAWAKKDSRFLVIHQPNGGAAHARNTALDHATAPYVTMVDGDDELAPDALALLYAAMREHDVDVVICGVSRNLEPCVAGEQADAGGAMQDVGNQAVFQSFSTAAWGKLYKRDILERWNIRYPIGVKIGEDYIFNVRYWFRVKSAYIIEKNLYRYCASETSVCKRFHEGSLPLEVYERTLQFNYQLYEEVMLCTDLLHSKREWCEALFDAHLNREFWVLCCVHHTPETRRALTAVAKRYRALFEAELPRSAALKIWAQYMRRKYKGLFKISGGKLKRWFFSKIHRFAQRG